MGGRGEGEERKKVKKIETVLLFLKSCFLVDCHKVLRGECWRKSPESQSWHGEGQVVMKGRL